MGNKEIEILQHQISYFYRKSHVMPEHEQEHVKQMIIDGYCEGELNDNGSRGYWSIKRKES